MRKLHIPLLLSVALCAASCGNSSADVAPAATAEQGAATLERADELLGAEKLEEAEEILRALLHTAEDPEPILLRLAYSLQRREELPKAIGLLKEHLKAHPEALEVSLYLIDLYVSIEQYRLAQGVVEAALEHAPEEPDLALDLGVCLAHEKQYAQAEEQFRRAGELGADLADVDFNLALIARSRHDHETAVARLQRVVERAPERLAAQRELAGARLEQSPRDAAVAEEVLPMLERVLLDDETDWRANEYMGDAYLALADYQAAVTYYTVALKYGRSPERIEEKYRVAASALNAELEAQGLLPEQQPVEQQQVPPFDTGQAREALERRFEEQLSGDGGQ